MIAVDIRNLHHQFANGACAALRRLAIIGFAVSMMAVLASPVAYAQSAEGGVTDSRQPVKISREYLIKAAILYNFAKFATWPEAAFSSDSAPLRLCVIGDDPFGPALNSLAGKTVRKRALVTSHIADVENAAPCHILFVSDSETERLDTILDEVATLPILTVADINRFGNSGGIITLKAVDKRSRIEVNIAAAEQAGLRLSSKLLRLADTVGSQTAHTQQVPK